MEYPVPAAEAVREARRSGTLESARNRNPSWVLPYKLEPTSDDQLGQKSVRATRWGNRSDMCSLAQILYFAAEFSRPCAGTQSASRAGQLESASSVCASPTPCGPRS